MAKHIYSDPTAFNKLSEFIKPYEAAGRTESAALLIWFLETIFRLDETEAQDAVCDRKHDVGIDAVAVRDDENEVVLFQAKRKQKLPATLGDVDLKEFVGSLQQFKSGESVKKIISSTSNDELRNLLTKHTVAQKIGNGYTI
jgi:restriction endonuclease Mrr